MAEVMCSKCGTQPPGEGSVLCPDCRREIGASTRNFWNTTQPEQADTVDGESDVADDATAVADEGPASPVS